ncbi:hypothetical protein A6V39_05710 [Candidatus Mycoplasma haematobovis]|uniref:Uncharacterized protein n=1 Tax=Candidatus Mycoplasma haematobovis TaxID=432608 RepID=A0A1A9QEB0_9MOLU|nr:hypothetical protein [Candidatus Mycoplasma haematobovis]OAL10803.1 hypothetical protein A6V39_05710 [Candidatus Mycoplasma haematobovis]
MKNATIVKFLIGLALTGATITGTALVAFPSQKTVINQKQKFDSRQEKKANGLRLLEQAFVKYKGDDVNSRKLAAVINSHPSAFVYFMLGDNDRFLDDGSAETSLISWCEKSNDSIQIPEEYSQILNRDSICEFTKITW